MRARLRVCTEPGCPEMQAGSRCRQHQADRDRRQRLTVPTKVFAGRDRVRRRAAVTAHRDRHGDWCPGFERDPHPSTDLSADHRVEMQAGGAWDGELDVLCRSCNSRKAKRTQDALREAVKTRTGVRNGARPALGVGGAPRARRGRTPRGRALKGAEGPRRPAGGDAR